ncbi:DUF624 domain-containing protein [Aquibacillus halophilus]|uniref:DUF624 domain-containing protein n=1 Tax=Aquibacillus halophilus TaxID=930132 RepID=A0A6A8D8K8_9BACI|nr:DUF624 domain-containing protein [Aquibacillus halophilus]MRH41934.1 DUF624 domain-containing protein [Aquibacillus halophilus]
MDKSENIFLKILDIFTHFLLINILWLIFCIPIITIFPATAALFGVVRKWTSEGIEAGMLSLFMKEFKGNFKKSFLIGIIWSIAAVILYLDFAIMLQVEFMGRMVLLTLLIFVTMLYMFTTIYIFFILVNYELTILHTIKNALFISISYIFHTILCMLLISIVLILTYFVPIFLLIFGSVLAFILYQVFHRLSYRIHETRAAN